MGCGCGKRARSKNTLSSMKKNTKDTNKNRKSDLLAKRGNSIRKRRLTKIVSSPKKFR